GVTIYLFGGLITTAPLFTHETPNLYYRLYEYYSEFQIRGFPPALFPNSISGGGFAFPIFYPPFGYYVGLLIALFQNSFYFAGNVSLFLSVLCSAYAAFYAFKQLGSTTTALTASIMYVAIPYRFVNAIARGALAECWTFT